ncbi:hypothetical protein GCM10010326_66480 [Streptomyces xanthochromogenes]|uniref:Uncharacterized protein n=1 Tax=Streptomyces xanthochromogenes TaxID=67384 RepID=A0ABQ3AQ53_9ACTN|nr:hypothetical protein GCM10010326_66480 [Streptomyces xanthochromogenes]
MMSAGKRGSLNSLCSTTVLHAHDEWSGGPNDRSAQTLALPAPPWLVSTVCIAVQDAVRCGRQVLSASVERVAV